MKQYPEVNFIAKSDSANINMDIWNEYSELAHKQYYHLKFKESVEDSYVSEDFVRQFSKFSIDDEKRLNKIDSICFSNVIGILDKIEYTGLVDNTGKYELTIPYGVYYVFVCSKNRTRPTLTEFTERKIIKEIKIDKPTKILSFDFDY